MHRLAGRLADPETADLLSRELARPLSAVLGALGEHHVATYVLELARRDLDRRSYAPVPRGWMHGSGLTFSSFRA